MWENSICIQREKKNFPIFNDLIFFTHSTFMTSTTSTDTGANSSNTIITVRKNIPIQSVTMDSYLKAKDEEMPVIPPPSATSATSDVISNIQQLPKSFFGNEDVPTSAILAAKLKQKNQSITNAKKAEVSTPPSKQEEKPVEVKDKNKGVVKQANEKPASFPSVPVMVTSVPVTIPVSMPAPISMPVHVQMSRAMPISLEPSPLVPLTQPLAQTWVMQID